MKNDSFAKVSPSIVAALGISFLLSVISGILSFVFFKNEVKLLLVVFLIVFGFSLTIFITYLFYVILAGVRALQDIASNTEKE